MLFFALDENKEIVFIQKAIKKKDYYCPECGGILRVKSGTKKCKHFFHLNCENCGANGESLAHKYFKEHFTEFLSFIPIKEKVKTDKTFIENRIVEMIVDNVYVKYEHTHETNLKTKRKKYNIKSFQVEVSIRKNDVIITPDVLVELENGEQCAVEVFYTNKKTDEHKDRYKRLNLSAIEVKIDQECNILGVRTLHNAKNLEDFDVNNNETLNYIKNIIKTKNERRSTLPTYIGYFDYKDLGYEYGSDEYEKWEEMRKKNNEIISRFDRDYDIGERYRSGLPESHKIRTFKQLDILLKNKPIEYLKLIVKEHRYDEFFIKNIKELYIHSFLILFGSSVKKDYEYFANRIFGHPCVNSSILKLHYKDEIIKRINEFVLEVEGNEF